ncbi:AroM family protein [Neorhizobium galegae]|uniref:AroM family protein n=1 Tax=Neorhizobium galegae TaxID=399 RepID=UPI000621ABA7|nr:AroM family protein [Neorhizobium galegae]CDZ29594.1 AroM protein [Neorhizobium galegae bv. officinalis]CDZ56178.1 AroM protein [Neorhizobium galegae bv. orientalis]KAA9388618.1 LuxR family transcriptional regulator [Neorhizobium galegae]KAB1113988.1 LuxR family transcriptional regulator [Neorhizobium galegae]KAB1123808.1 LuxR family transcriptional regulator [Neorhizobium galegae]
MSKSPYALAPTSPEGAEPHHRVMFLSVGQTPRADLIGDMLTNLDVPIEALEIGALDGLSKAEIDDLKVRPGEQSIVTRLADNTDIVVSKPRIAERMAKIAAAFQPNEFDLVVILSTGLFRDFESTCPTVNAQRAMESAVISLAAHGSSVGLIQPLQQQIAELDIPALAPYKICASYAADGDRKLLAGALVDLADAEIIVLNSVSFTEADRQMVAKASGKPVVLARRIVASAIRLLLHRSQPVTLPGVSPEFAEKLLRLTPRERQVLSLVAEGLSNKAIARQLGISPKTVEIHRSNVMSKMEVTSSNALIRMVISAGHP